MSLIGSLEDLSLGDILQIISLSQKSGVLALRTNDGDGRIVFRAGLVCGAVVKGGPSDLRSALVHGGFIEAADYDAATAASSGCDEAAAALVGADLISAERLDSLRREVVEAAVVAMFRWRVGDFSFDVREQRDPEDPEWMLPIGVNAQYLAMEGARCADEGGDAVHEEEAFDQMSAAEMFGAAPESAAADLVASPFVSPPTAQAVGAATPQPRSGLGAVFDTLAEAVLEQHAPAEETEPVRDGPEVALALEMEAEPGASPGAESASKSEAESETETESDPVAPAAPIAASDAEAPEAEAAAVFDRARPVIVIDGDLPALEWTRDVLASECERVHIFQRSDLGLTRIRQYLARAVAPIVLLSPATPGDRLSGIPDAVDFVRRLKQQAPMMRVIWLQEDGVVAVAEPGPADAIATRPASHRLRASGSADATGEDARALRELVLRPGMDHPVPVAAGPSLPGAALEELKLATSRLQDASRRGEVLSVVIDCASKRFRRVAMLMIRNDDAAVGIAQHDLALCGGPDDDGLRRFEMPVSESAWLTRVARERKAICTAPEGSGDLRLVEALGDRVPTAAYLAPIESAGRVVAIVYGDDLPGGGTPTDTSGLEVVLHHAGLALDRAVLERALTAEESN